MPLYYTHDDSGMKVRLLAYTLNYPAEGYDIRECDMELDRSIRTFGSGGVGGYLWISDTRARTASSC